MTHALPLFPPEAKPHELAVLLCYALGIHEADAIATFLHYKSKHRIYRTLKKYRHHLAALRVPTGTDTLPRSSSFRHCLIIPL